MRNSASTRSRIRYPAYAIPTASGAYGCCTGVRFERPARLFVEEAAFVAGHSHGKSCVLVEGVARGVCRCPNGRAIHAWSARVALGAADSALNGPRFPGLSLARRPRAPGGLRRPWRRRDGAGRWLPRSLGALGALGRDLRCRLPAGDAKNDARPVGHPPVGLAEQSHQRGHE
jgi:hypothetical protein